MLLVSAVSSVIIGRKEHSDRQLPAENSQGSMLAGVPIFPDDQM